MACLYRTGYSHVQYAKKKKVCFNHKQKYFIPGNKKEKRPVLLPEGLDQLWGQEHWDERSSARWKYLRNSKFFLEGSANFAY